MSASSAILRGPAARSARPLPLAGRLAPVQVEATGPWADRADQALQAARAEGLRQGRAEGVRQGQAEGRAEVSARTGAALGALEAAAERMARVDAASVADLGARVVDLAVELAQLILQRELATTPDPGLDAMRRVLADAPEQGQLVVRLNPGDLAVLGQYHALAPGRDVTVVPDPALASGDAIVDCGPTRIDGRLTAAVSRVGAALRGEAVPA